MENISKIKNRLLESREYHKSLIKVLLSFKYRHIDTNRGFCHPQLSGTTEMETRTNEHTTFCLKPKLSQFFIKRYFISSLITKLLSFFNIRMWPGGIREIALTPLQPYRRLTIYQSGISDIIVARREDRVRRNTFIPLELRARSWGRK